MQSSRTPKLQLRKSSHSSMHGETETRWLRTRWRHKAEERRHLWPTVVKETDPPTPERRRHYCEQPLSSMPCPSPPVAWPPSRSRPCPPLSPLGGPEARGEEAPPARGAPSVFPGEYASPRLSCRLPDIPKQRGGHPLHTTWIVNRYKTTSFPNILEAFLFLFGWASWLMGS